MTQWRQALGVGLMCVWAAALAQPVDDEDTTGETPPAEFPTNGLPIDEVSAGGIPLAEIPIEEVVVVAFDRCGPWPIDHPLTSDCLFAVIKRDKVRVLQQMRARMLTACLRCEDAICTPRVPAAAEDADRRKTRFVCEKLFFTPRRVGGWNVEAEEAPELFLGFTYDISRQGRVRDIRITDFDEEDFDHDQLLTLLQVGSERVRFEPLKIDGVVYEIIGVRGSYQLTTAF